MINWAIYVVYLVYHLALSWLECLFDKSKISGFIDIKIYYRRVSRQKLAESLRPKKRNGGNGNNE